MEGNMMYDYIPTSWSFSALHTYEECPLRYVLDKTLTGPRETSWALEEGLRIHALMEHYLIGDIEGVPRELTHFSTQLKKFKRDGAKAEGEICLDKDWNKVKAKNAWRSKKTWIRAKLDAQNGPKIIDLKTGRQYGYYVQQADLYATLTFQLTDLARVDFEFWYSKSGITDKHKFLRKDHEKRMAKWNKRAMKLMNEKHWLPKLNDGCKWCNYKDKCELWP
jgi:hypothetical protein